MIIRSENDIVKTVTWLTAIMVFVLVIVIPIGYFSLSRQHIVGSLESEAEMNAQIISQIIGADADMWQFEQVRLGEYLSRRPRKGHAETRRILAVNGAVIAESADVLQRPVIVRNVSLFDAGHPVGSLEIARSLGPLLTKTGLLMLFLAPLGALAFPGPARAAGPGPAPERNSAPERTGHGCIPILTWLKSCWSPLTLNSGSP